MIDLKLNKRILLVEVENGTKDFLVDEGDLCFIGNYGGFADIRMLKHLPSGNWSQPIKASEVTEDTCKQIMETVKEWRHMLYYNYTAKAKDYRDIVESSFLSATDSFLSLLTHHSLSSDKTILIIENIIH